MYLQSIAIVVGMMAAFVGHYVGAEIALDWLYGWHLDYVKKLKPITDAYRRFKQRHEETETKEGVS